MRIPASGSASQELDLRQHPPCSWEPQSVTQSTASSGAAAPQILQHTIDYSQPPVLLSAHFSSTAHPPVHQNCQCPDLCPLPSNPFCPSFLSSSAWALGSISSIFFANTLQSCPAIVVLVAFSSGVPNSVPVKLSEPHRDLWGKSHSHADCCPIMFMVSNVRLPRNPSVPESSLFPIVAI